jgi:hypothetical protein
MAQLISDGRNGFSSAREDTPASAEVNVQVTFLSSGDGIYIPSSHVIDFPQHKLLSSRYSRFFSTVRNCQNGCISGLDIQLMVSTIKNPGHLRSKVNGLIRN